MAYATSAWSPPSRSTCDYKLNPKNPPREHALLGDEPYKYTHHIHPSCIRPPLKQKHDYNQFFARLYPISHLLQIRGFKFKKRQFMKSVQSINKSRLMW